MTIGWTAAHRPPQCAALHSLVVSLRLIDGCELYEPHEIDARKQHVRMMQDILCEDPFGVDTPSCDLYNNCNRARKYLCVI